MSRVRKKELINSIEAAKLIQEWRDNPIQSNRDKVFMLLVETSKAVIGKLQNSYGMQVKDYDDKVIDSTCKLIEALDKHKDLIPRNIINWAYLYVLGTVFNKKTKEMEQEILIDDFNKLYKGETYD